MAEHEKNVKFLTFGIIAVAAASIIGMGSFAVETMSGAPVDRDSVNHLGNRVGAATAMPPQEPNPPSTLPAPNAGASCLCTYHVEDLGYGGWLEYTWVGSACALDGGSEYATSYVEPDGAVYDDQYPGNAVLTASQHESNMACASQNPPIKNRPPAPQRDTQQVTILGDCECGHTEMPRHGDWVQYTWRGPDCLLDGGMGCNCAIVETYEDWERWGRDCPYDGWYHPTDPQSHITAQEREENAAFCSDFDPYAVSYYEIGGGLWDDTVPGNGILSKEETQINMRCEAGSGGIQTVTSGELQQRACKATPNGGDCASGFECVFYHEVMPAGCPGGTGAYYYAYPEYSPCDQECHEENCAFTGTC